jgi:hypothetical protein
MICDRKNFIFRDQIMKKPEFTRRSFLKAMGGVTAGAFAFPDIFESRLWGRSDSVAASDAQHVIWSRKPAPAWQEGYPIGNGRLGGMVAGEPCRIKSFTTQGKLQALHYGETIPGRFENGIFEFQTQKDENYLIRPVGA